MMRYILCLFVSCISLSSFSAKVTKSLCDSAYSQHLYDQALKGYESLIDEGPRNSDLLYNAGNCYYRLKNLPKAILYYERAARINPSDADVRHNLALARAQTEDKFYSSSDLDVVYSFNSFVNTFGTDGWAWMSVLAFTLFVFSILLVRFMTQNRMRRWAFGLMTVSLLCVVLSNIFAMIQRTKYNDRSKAIVMKTTNLMSTPDTIGTNIFTLHGGTKVELTDTTLSAWSEVSLSDGQKGWVQNSDIESI